MSAQQGVCYTYSNKEKKIKTIPGDRIDACFSALTSFPKNMMAVKGLNIKQIDNMDLKDNNINEVKRLLRTIPRVYSITTIQKGGTKDKPTGRLLVKLSFEETDQYPFRWIVLGSIRELFFVYDRSKSAYSKFLEQRKHDYSPKTAVGFVAYCNTYCVGIPADHPSWSEISFRVERRRKEVLDAHLKVINDPSFGNSYISFGQVLSKSNDQNDVPLIDLLKERNL